MLQCVWKVTRMLQVELPTFSISFFFSSSSITVTFNCYLDSAGSSGSDTLKLKAWKTLPLVEDVCVLEKNAVVNISGLS